MKTVFKVAHTQTFSLCKKRSLLSRFLKLKENLVKERIETLAESYFVYAETKEEAEDMCKDSLAEESKEVRKRFIKVHDRVYDLWRNYDVKDLENSFTTVEDCCENKYRYDFLKEELPFSAFAELCKNSGIPY